MGKIKYLFLFILLSISTVCFGQDYKDYLDPTWDKYYDNNPSGIESNFKGNDFIKVIDYVKFIPRRNEIKSDVSKLKQILLIFDFADLRQMSMTGDFYSRSKKHDDYYYLYNSFYTKIDKNTWDKYAPYLIPLMEIDGLIKLN
jgi:hypothetical protein